jgi:hypothetical protein
MMKMWNKRVLDRPETQNVIFGNVDAMEQEPETKHTERRKRIRTAVMMTDSEESMESEESEFSEHSIPPSPKQTTPKKEKVKETVWVPEPREPPEWLSKNIPVRTPYLPQIQDMVVYIKQGHVEFVTKNAAYYPYVIDETLPDLVLGRVVEITFTPGAIIYCTVKMAIYPQLLVEDINVKELPTTEITFFDANDCPDFLILWQDFEQSQRVHWELGDKVVSRYGDGEFEGVIADITDLETPWEKYGVKFENTAEITRFSPWELRREDQAFATYPTIETQGFACLIRN